MTPLLWGEVRRRWRGAAVMGLLFGVGFAVALGSAAGARRTASAYPRMLRTTNAPQLIVGGEDSSPAARKRVYDRVAKVPGVGSRAPIAGVALVPIGVPKNAGVAGESCLNMALDGRAWHRVGAPNILSGRLPSAGRSDEILVSRSYVDTYGVRVGDRLTLVAPKGDGTSADRVTAADGPAVAVTVVGVGSFATDVLPVSDLDAAPTAIGERALLERIAPDSDDWCYDGVFLTLAPGARVKQVVGALEAIGDDTLPFIQDLTANYAEVRRAIQPQVTALWLFSAVAGLATLLLAGQLLTRQLQHSAAVSAPVWRALGAGRRQVVALVAAPCAVTAGVAGITATAGAVALSGRFPIGPARLAETAPGVRFDAPVQFGGGAVVAASSLVIGLVAATLVVRRRGAARAPIVARLSAVASRPAVVVGVHLATDAGQGDRTVPVRSAVAGTALCVAAILSTVTFAHGLQTLVSRPSNYGQDWDVMVDSAFGLAPTGAVLDELGRDPAVVAVAGGRYGTATIGGTDVPAIGLADLRGSTFPAMIKGRRPVRSDEIVLGERSVRAIGHSIGDRIDVNTGGRPVEMTIVGTAVFPRLNMGSFSTLGLGQGAVLRADAFPPRSLPEEADAPPNFVARDYEGPGGGLYEFLTLRLRAGAAAGDRRRVLAAAHELPGHGAYVIRTEQRPVAIANYAAVRSTPVVLATLLSLMAAATLAHVLGSAVRRRRRDLALCAVLGMDRRQLSASVLIQAVLVSGVALAVGLPLGIAGGRLAWGGFASDLGVPDRLQMPLVAIVLMVPVVVVAAAAVALVPAVIASRTPRATTLRTE